MLVVFGCVLYVSVCVYVLVCVVFVVLLVASVLASMRWLLCGGDGSKEKSKDFFHCRFKLIRKIKPH